MYCTNGSCGFTDVGPETTSDSGETDRICVVQEDEAAVLFGLTDSGLVGTSAACAITSTLPGYSGEIIDDLPLESSSPSSYPRRAKFSLRGEKNARMAFEPNPTVRKRLQER